MWCSAPGTCTASGMCGLAATDTYVFGELALKAVKCRCVL